MKSLDLKSKEDMSSGAGSLNIKKDEYDSGHEGCDPNLQGDGSLDADDDQQFS